MQVVRIYTKVKNWRVLVYTLTTLTDLVRERLHSSRNWQEQLAKKHAVHGVDGRCPIASVRAAVPDFLCRLDF